jgi:hypothetical protein
MAKADFCFTYYDGDAARDMSHMNRLERGGYTDIIISQRKFGRLSLDQIRKILGHDFDACWPAIELVMKKELDKYSIEWLMNSEAKAKKHSTKQRENVSNRYQEPTNPLPKSDLVTPLEDGDESEDVVVPERKGVQGETIEARLDAALDSRTLDEIRVNARLAYPGVDLDREITRFRMKVAGSPSVYQDHDTGGLRLAFHSHLRFAKGDPTPKSKVKSFNLDEV